MRVFLAPLFEAGSNNQCYQRGLLDETVRATCQTKYRSSRSLREDKAPSDLPRPLTLGGSQVWARPYPASMHACHAVPAETRCRLASNPGLACRESK